MKINSSFVAFIGFLNYEPFLIERNSFHKDFTPTEFYSKNQNYLRQKYYMNWLQSMFFMEGDKPNSYTYRYVDNLPTSNGFKTTAVEVLLFKDNMGIFVIKCRNDNDNQNWENLIDFVNHNRLNHHYEQGDINFIITEIISTCLLGNFVQDNRSWQKHNAQLKVFTNVDVKHFENRAIVDAYLFALGNHSYPDKEGLFQPSKHYFDEVISDHKISVYDNWKVLGFYDSLSRISENLDEVDTYKLWENEYLYLYINTLLIRFFLQKFNDDLVDLSKNPKSLLRSRNLFFDLINQYNHSKISYKFLPNLLFTEFKKSLEITPEIDAVEKKIVRLNAIIEEKSNKKIQTILTILTLFSIFSFANDGGAWLGIQDKGSLAFIIGTLIFFVAVILTLYLYFRKEKN